MVLSSIRSFLVSATPRSFRAPCGSRFGVWAALILAISRNDLQATDPYSHLDPDTRAMLLQVLQKHGVDPSGGALPGSVLSSSRDAPGLPRVFAPSQPRVAYSKYPWKKDVVATVFWVGEPKATEVPSPTNAASSWDTKWQETYGGYDDPDPNNRTWDYCPRGFTPKQNPFYVALPYNDAESWNLTKPTARRVIPWFSETFRRSGKSVLKSRWVAIRRGSRQCFAQWEDVGPFLTDDWAYVFGTARPSNQENGGAGIDLSPAVRDYLGLRSGTPVDWHFVELEEVENGPWRKYGENNPFVTEKIRQEQEEKKKVQDEMVRLREARDAFVRERGNFRR